MDIVRIGKCRVCGKSFKVFDENFESIKQYWNPDICKECNEKQKTNGENKK